jgi:hypothetical protein
MDPLRRGNADGIRLRIAARCAPEGRGGLRYLMGFMIQTAADGHGLPHRLGWRSKFISSHRPPAQRPGSSPRAWSGLRGEDPFAACHDARMRQEDSTSS